MKSMHLKFVNGNEKYNMNEKFVVNTNNVKKKIKNNVKIYWKSWEYTLFDS
jgi:hypothetical protein